MNKNGYTFTNKFKDNQDIVQFLVYLNAFYDELNLKNKSNDILNRMNNNEIHSIYVYDDDKLVGYLIYSLTDNVNSVQYHESEMKKEYINIESLYFDKIIRFKNYNFDGDNVSDNLKNIIMTVEYLAYKNGLDAVVIDLVNVSKLVKRFNELGYNQFDNSNPSVLKKDINNEWYNCRK